MGSGGGRGNETTGQRRRRKERRIMEQRKERMREVVEKGAVAGKGGKAIEKKGDTLRDTTV